MELQALGDDAPLVVLDLALRRPPLGDGVLAAELDQAHAAEVGRVGLVEAVVDPVAGVVPVGVGVVDVRAAASVVVEAEGGRQVLVLLVWVVWLLVVALDGKGGRSRRDLRLEQAVGLLHLGELGGRDDPLVVQPLDFGVDLGR